MAEMNKLNGFFVYAFVLLLFLFLSTVDILAQEKKDIFTISTIPRRSRKALAARLNSYVEYQRAKQWEKAVTLLGDFKVNLDGKGRRYKKEEKEELSERLEGLGLTSFEPIILTVSTRIYSQPLGQRFVTTVFIIVALCLRMISVDVLCLIQSVLAD